MANEKKAIYAEDLFTVLRDDINISGANLARIKRHIANSPAVDAVEVVRCKDCKCWQKRYETKGICFKHNSILTFTNPDFYCSYGERREGE